MIRLNNDIEIISDRIMIRLNNDIEIPQIGVGTWTLRGETARQNLRSNVLNDPEKFPW